MQSFDTAGGNGGYSDQKERVDITRLLPGDAIQGECFGDFQRTGKDPVNHPALDIVSLGAVSNMLKLHEISLHKSLQIARQHKMLCHTNVLSFKTQDTGMVQCLENCT